MALPPEPIEEVMPNAAAIVEAEVVEVLSTGPKPPPPDTTNMKRGATSVGFKAASQVVKLKVTRVHKGPNDLKEVVVQKPEAGYSLKPGNKGPFVLDGGKPQPTILGRYGPDTWDLARILKAIK